MTKTIFCDIDGTILEHKGDIFKNINNDHTILEGVLDKFKEWDKNNYTIILTTGRKESWRKITEEQLLYFGIPYDKLIMGLPNGERIIINDKKPNSVKNTAIAINLVRNKGMNNININKVFSSNLHIDKPWGSEDIIEHNDNYVVKKLYMKEGHQCSLQYHELKTETITVLSGKLLIYTGNDVNNLEQKEYNIGESITIKPYTFHRMKGLTDCIYLETSTNELWDVIRIEDLYGRC